MGSFLLLRKLLIQRFMSTASSWITMTVERQARDVIKAIKKRLGSKSNDTQLFVVMLLEVLMNNIGEPVHTQVIDTGILPVLVKLVKKKPTSDLPVREKIFLLLDATQTSLGGALTATIQNLVTV